MSIDFVRRKNGRSGVESEDWPKLNLFLNEVLKEDGSINPEEFFKEDSLEKYAFLRSMFEVSPEEAIHQIRMGIARTILGGVNNDGHKSFIYKKGSKDYAAFNSVYKSNEHFDYKYILGLLHQIKAKINQDHSMRIEDLIQLVKADLERAETRES